MAIYIDQQWLLATRRVKHELMQPADYIYRQLELRSEQINTQSSQVEGRIHHKLLQRAGNLQYQLPPDLDVSRDISPLDDTDDGRHKDLSQHGGQSDVPHDVSPPDDADNGRQGTLQGDDQDQVRLLYVHHGHRGQGGVLEGGGREK